MNSKTLVMKFGGTSVGSPKAIENVVEIVGTARKDFPNVVVVVSAMSGVTNMLSDTAEAASHRKNGLVSEVKRKLARIHFEAAKQLLTPASFETFKSELSPLLEEFGQLCHAIQILADASPRTLDAVTSLGERMSIRLVSAVLEDRGISSAFVEASELILTDDQFQNAHPNIDLSIPAIREKLGAFLSEGKTPVVTGYVAGTPDGVITTLGRGGSDYSAALLGAALPADEVWIWTDVDGVMSADPRSVPTANTIPQLSYREVSELAYFGAKVLHPRTIFPIMKRGIALRVRNTFKPKHPGTLIIPDNQKNGQGRLKAVTAIRGQRMVTIEGRGMLGVPGVAARAFGAVAATGTSVILITQASSEQSICFVVPGASVGLILEELERVFERELSQNDIDRVWATEDVVIITAVGAGMKYTSGVAGQIFTALGDANVNVLAIAQGSSEAAISLVVDENNADQAINAIHGMITFEAEGAYV